MKTDDGFDYRETPWEQRRINGKNYMIKHATVSIGNTDIARFPGIMKLSDFRHGGPEKRAALDENMINSANDCGLEYFDIYPYGPLLPR